jgi:hypothetical protein
VTDTTTAEAPEPVPPVPEVVAEIEAVAPDAAEQAAAPLPPEADTRALPEIEHPIGPLRQAVLDALLDADEPLSVSRILAEMPPGTSRNSAESAIKRESDVGRIERVAPGVYRLAPPKPAEPSKPAAQPAPIEEATWFAALEAWINDPETWDRERFGPRPDEPGRRIPAGVVAKGVDRNRKRQERRKDAEAAATKQAAADRDLRDKLLAATGSNYAPELVSDDLAPIKAAMDLVPLDVICRVIGWKVNKLYYPGNPRLTSWRDPRLLKAIAKEFCEAIIIPKSVDAWSKAVGTAPQKPVERVAAAPATQPAHEPESAPAASPPQPDRIPDGNAGALGIEAPAQPTRDSILAAFARNRVPPEPVAPPPVPPRPTEPEPERDEISEAGWDEICSGYYVGNLDWSRRKWGPPPGDWSDRGDEPLFTPIKRVRDVREHCLECSSEVAREVRECRVINCPFWAYQRGWHGTPSWQAHSERFRYAKSFCCLPLGDISAIPISLSARQTEVRDICLLECTQKIRRMSCRSYQYSADSPPLTY